MMTEKLWWLTRIYE